MHSHLRLISDWWRARYGGSILLLLVLALTAACGEVREVLPPAISERIPERATPTVPPPTLTPEPPTATPEPTAPPAPTVTPTPALPPMTVYADANDVITIRAPTAWDLEAESSPLGVNLALSDPRDESILFLQVSPTDHEDEQALEVFISTFLGDQEEGQRETLEDGTVRLSGRGTAGRGRFEARIRQHGLLLSALIVAADDAAWERNERVFAEAFDSFRLFPENAWLLFRAREPLPPFDPAALEIVSATPYYSDPRTLWVLGEVENTGFRSAESLAVTVELLGSDESIVAAREGYAELEVLLSGERAPFAVLFDNAPAASEWATMTATVYGSPATFYLRRMHRGLVLAQVGPAEPSGTAAHRVTGLVGNEGESPAEFVRVVGALYDDMGLVVAVSSTYADAQVLDPAQSAPFDLQFLSAAVEPEVVFVSRIWVTGAQDP
jgi:hypothetical protein